MLPYSQGLVAADESACSDLAQILRLKQTVPWIRAFSQF